MMLCKMKTYSTISIFLKFRIINSFLIPEKSKISQTTFIYSRWQLLILLIRCYKFLIRPVITGTTGHCFIKEKLVNILH